MKQHQGMEVSHSNLINELSKELQYLENGGTSYRKETARRALTVARETRDIHVFTDRNLAIKTTSNFLIEEDTHRINDVAKMLNVVVSDLHYKASLSDEIKEKLEKRSRIRKPIRIIPAR